MVEQKGFEPSTPTLRTWCSPSRATAPSWLAWTRYYCWRIVWKVESSDSINLPLLLE